jgi:DNA-binding ferritin-like protein
VSLLPEKREQSQETQDAIAERLTQLEQAAEEFLALSEQAMDADEDEEEDVADELYESIARLAFVVRKACNCARLGLAACVCPGEGRH